MAHFVTTKYTGVCFIKKRDLLLTGKPPTMLHMDCGTYSTVKPVAGCARGTRSHLPVWLEQFPYGTRDNRK
jgi:hypothetical protein